MDFPTPTIGPDVTKLKAKALELQLELTVIETGWLKRRKLRKELKKVMNEIESQERTL